MPKQANRDKDFRGRRRTRSRSVPGKATSVKDLLAKAGISEKTIAQRSVKQRSWQEFFVKTLPDGLAEHIHAVDLQRGRLTVSANAPVWAVRLRYALEERLAAIRARDSSVLTIVVTVTRPR